MNTHLSPHASPLGLRNGHDPRSGLGLGHRSGRGRRSGPRYPDCHHSRGESRCQKPDDLLRHHENQSLEGCRGRKRLMKCGMKVEIWRQVEWLTSVVVPAVPVLVAVSVAVPSSVVTVIVPPRPISVPIRLVTVT